MLYGVSLSSDQGNIDWELFTEKPVQFMSIRAVVGKNIDPRVNDYVSGAKYCKVPYSLYHSVIPRNTTNFREQAELMAGQIAIYNPSLPPVLNIDETTATTMNKGAMNNWLFKYCKYLTELTGKEVIISTTTKWWNSHVERGDWAKYRRLWIKYPARSGEQPTIPDDWGAINNPRTWTFWTYSVSLESSWGTENAAIPLMYFNGGVNEFMKLFGVEPRPINYKPTPIPTEEGLLFEVGVSSLNIRSGPGVEYDDVGDLIQGQVVKALDVGGSDAWIKIGIGKWVCVELAGNKYLKLVNI